MQIKTLDDINSLIRNRIEESNTLEYKRELGSDNKEIAKDISAFANTNGGTIIYGVVCKDKVASDVNWIADEGVEEKIQNIINTSLHPRLEPPQVTRLTNPSDDTRAIYVVTILGSLHKPHMINQHYRYYMRRSSESVPMEDADVKNAIFGTGRLVALQYEISSNSDLAERTRKLIEEIMVYPFSMRQTIVLIPFHTDAWNAVIASGLLFSLGNEIVEKLVKAYRFIHEVNTIITCLNMDIASTAHTPMDPSSAKHGIYLPALIQNKLPQLGNQLQELSRLLSA